MKSISFFLKQLFSFFFLLTLILFLAENFLPGFVSEIFPFPWLFATLLFFGLFSVLLPKIEEEPPWQPTLIANIIVWIIGICAGVVIFNRLSLQNNLLRVGVSVVFGFFIVTFGKIFLKADYEVKRDIPKIGGLFGEEKKSSNTPAHSFLSFKIFKNRIFVSCFLLVFIFLLLGGFLLIRNRYLISKDNTGAPSLETAPRVDPSLKIVIYNAGLNQSDIDAIILDLSHYGYKNFQIEISDQHIDGIRLEFPDQVAGQANLISQILQKNYRAITRFPLKNDINQIMIYIGSPSTNQQVNPADSDLLN